MPRTLGCACFHACTSLLRKPVSVCARGRDLRLTRIDIGKILRNQDSVLERKCMSNEMFLGDTTFHISPDKEEAARVALAQVAEKSVEADNWRAGDIKEMAEGRECGVTELTLDDLVQCWGWSLIRDTDKTHEIIGIDLLEDFSSDEET